MIKYIKKIITSFFIKISLTLSRLENTLIRSNKDIDKTGGDLEIDNIQNELLKSLRKGEYNKEYVDKFYKILKKSDDIMIIDKSELYDVAKRRGMDVGNEDLMFYLNSNLISNDSLEDRYINDEHQLENIIKNKVEIKNPLYILDNEEPKYNTTIKSIDPNRTIYIENITDALHIKRIDNNVKILEFYIQNSLLQNKDIESLSKLSNIKFKDKYGEEYKYLITNYIDFIENKGYKILRYKANVI